jgi:UrcA family protein
MTTTSLLRTAASTTLTLVLLTPLVSLSQSLAPTKGVDGVPAVAVKYGDLDLNNPAAREVLFKRIKNAAKTVCAPFDGAGLARHHVFDACVDHAIAGAVIQTNAPAMAALYTEKTGNKLAPNPLLTAHR